MKNHKTFRWFDVVVSFSGAHWSVKHRNEITHGPQTWPWWRIAVLKLYNLRITAPSTGYRFWLYTRWGSLLCDVTFDRRPDL